MIYHLDKDILRLTPNIYQSTFAHAPVHMPCSFFLGNFTSNCLTCTMSENWGPEYFYLNMLFWCVITWKMRDLYTFMCRMPYCSAMFSVSPKCVIRTCTSPKCQTGPVQSFVRLLKDVTPECEDLPLFPEWITTKIHMFIYLPNPKSFDKILFVTIKNVFLICH